MTESDIIQQFGVSLFRYENEQCFLLFIVAKNDLTHVRNQLKELERRVKDGWSIYAIGLLT